MRIAGWVSNTVWPQEHSTPPEHQSHRLWGGGGGGGGGRRGGREKRETEWCEEEQDAFTLIVARRDLG